MVGFAGCSLNPTGQPSKSPQGCLVSQSSSRSALGNLQRTIRYRAPIRLVESTKACDIGRHGLWVDRPALGGKRRVGEDAEIYPGGIALPAGNGNG